MLSKHVVHCYSLKMQTLRPVGGAVGNALANRLYETFVGRVHPVLCYNVHRIPEPYTAVDRSACRQVLLLTAARPQRYAVNATCRCASSVSTMVSPSPGALGRWNSPSLSSGLQRNLSHTTSHIGAAAAFDADGLETDLFVAAAYQNVRPSAHTDRTLYGYTAIAARKRT